MLVTLTLEASDRDRLKAYLAGEIDTLTLDTAVIEAGGDPLAPPDPATAGKKSRGRPKKTDAATSDPSPVPAPTAVTPPPQVPQPSSAPTGVTPPPFMPSVMTPPGMMPMIPVTPVTPPPQPAHPFDDPAAALRALQAALSSYNGQPVNDPGWTSAKGAILDNAMFFGDLPSQLSQCQTAEQRQRFIDRVNRMDWAATMTQSRGAGLAAKVQEAINGLVRATVASDNMFSIPDSQWGEFKARVEQMLPSIS